ncbi:MAG: RsmB/NOP family class I SAM-dependent RNA methyltransferase [Hyphomicrobiales bacterium]|nr:RsmB/NOP family class I SAM-dependent RNA methyltransferase [Hyphomicrobiales bacterium]
MAVPEPDRQQRNKPAADAGLAPRRVALDLLSLVLRQARPLADLLDADSPEDGLARLSERDRALALMITYTALRRLGQIDACLKRIYRSGVPARAGTLEEVLRIGAAQILFLNVPAHAAVDLSVRLADLNPRARHYRSLVNAGLRRLAERGATLIAQQDEARLNTPLWLWQSWLETYGEETARAIASAHLVEPALDLTVKEDAAGWAERLNGIVLSTGSVRLVRGGRIEALEGYREGAWWVQDAAASLPARLLRDVTGKTVLDLCAAPGGKTAQLASAGARVVAVEKSPRRARRLEENLRRLGLSAEIVVADMLEWRPGTPADAVLLDAPCTASGTLRRHPDAAWLKRARDRDELVALQRQLLACAVSLIRPGGELVFCTCSLEPEEGEQQITRLLEAGAPVRRAPITPDDIGGLDEGVTASGDLRTLPFMLPNANPRLSGMDGFFAARLVRT